MRFGILLKIFVVANRLQQKAKKQIGSLALSRIGLMQVVKRP
jgi:hypothetical protein